MRGETNTANEYCLRSPYFCVVSSLAYPAPSPPPPSKPNATPSVSQNTDERHGNPKFSVSVFLPLDRCVLFYPSLTLQRLLGETVALFQYVVHACAETVSCKNLPALDSIDKCSSVAAGSPVRFTWLLVCCLADGGLHTHTHRRPRLSWLIIRTPCWKTMARPKQATAATSTSRPRTGRIPPKTRTGP